eukprot:scaffold718_cov252-Pinguiococcus_pyrenoidosus.AAC.7
MAVYQSSTILKSKLKAKHAAISYHRTREAIAAGVVVIEHIGTEWNPRIGDVGNSEWSRHSSHARITSILSYCQKRASDALGSLLLRHTGGRANELVQGVGSIFKIDHTTRYSSLDIDHMIDPGDRSCDRLNRCIDDCSILLRSVHTSPVAMESLRAAGRRWRRFQKREDRGLA